MIWWFVVAIQIVGAWWIASRYRRLPRGPIGDAPVWVVMGIAMAVPHSVGLALGLASYELLLLVLPVCVAVAVVGHRVLRRSRNENRDHGAGPSGGE